MNYALLSRDNLLNTTDIYEMNNVSREVPSYGKTECASARDILQQKKQETFLIKQ